MNFSDKLALAFSLILPVTTSMTEAAAQPVRMPVVEWTVGDASDFRYRFLENVKTTKLWYATPEIGTFSRFEHPKKLMAFLGLVPTENSSGTSKRQGVISKCGNPHARWILIEQATHYRVPPKLSAQLSKRQEGKPRWIRELSWKTQTRLSHRFSTLRKRQLHHNKIKVSVARELCAFLWELGTRIEAKQHQSATN